KVYRGQRAGLKEPSLLARKTKEEQALKQSIAKDARRQKEYGSAFESIATARKNFASYERDRRFLDLAAGFNTQLFGYARVLVRYAAESAKPSAERLPEYTDARLPALGAALAADTPLYLDFEKMKLADSLNFMAS